MAFRNHRFSRLELLIGREGLGRFRNLHVLIVGAGGVGGFAAEAIARAAVGKVTVVDHDDVCVTNVNRQIHAFTDTVGKKKVDLLVERLQKINPLASYFGIDEHHHPDKNDFIFEEAERLAGQPVDAVIDCIDTLIPKVDLIARCKKKDIPIWSSMGSASRLDPSQIKCADISETKNDKFAKQIRLKLREVGITNGVRVVYSTEEAIDPEQAVPGTEWNCICPTIEKEFGACQHKRVMLGTISYIPPIFGMWLAGDLLQHYLKGIDFKNRDTFEKVPTYDEFKKVLKLGQG
ncbi:ThiF family adenylyltransferase [Silvanigrella sp.]|jgi:tRNA A37 threonylcarbamoyladenosine dehydratase|uniref:tRNA threonylcarbamoyladenosine dehydratase n=1 Tax=Silvanigrella sp. TaxID=2024976 RepID=UPI0037CA55EC